MLNSREIKILEFLIKHGDVPENRILEDNKINKRNFLYNLQNINAFLENMGLKKIERREKLLYFDITQNLEKIYIVLNNIGKFDQKERIKILEYKLFFDEKLNLKKISEDLEVSKTTIKKDFHILKNILSEKNIKILYKNLVMIVLITAMITALGAVYAFTNKSYKSEINLYGNDRVLNEIGETSQYSLNSFDFFLFIKKNSKTLKNTGLSDEKFLKDMSSRLNAQSETNNPTIKVKFSTKSKTEGEEFSKEYVQLATEYLGNKENKFLDTQIKLLEEQYNFITKNTDIRTTKDSLSDTLVSRLAYYRLLKNDTSPVVKLISLNTKPALSKKIILAGALFLGLFLGVFAAFIKEFSKTLDWNEIKDKN